MSGQLKERYTTEVVPALLKQFEYANPMQVPRLDKIVVNIGLGEALSNAKAVDAAVGDVQLITGQKPIVTRAKRSIAQFRVRTGNPIGVKVTLRGERMWDFLERTTRLALPRIRDFRGVPGRSFDGRGNYSLGPPGAACLPGDRLRQGGPSPRAGDQHRDDGEDRRGVEAFARAPRHALRRLGAGGVGMAKKSLIAKAKRTPHHPVQAYNRCYVCGRPRAYMRRFALCRICFRERALVGELPGVTKSSW